MNFKSTRRACYVGYITQAIVVNLPPLLFAIFQDKFNVSLAYLAFLTLVTFLVQIAIDVLAVRFVERFGYRFLATSSQIVSAVGLVLLSILPYVIPSEAGLMIAAVIYSAGSGLTEVVLSPLIESLPEEDNSGSSLAMLHSFYAWGHTLVIIATTFLILGIGRDMWYVIPLVWALVPIINAVRFAKVPMVQMMVNKEESSTVALLKYKFFILAFVLMICSGAAEQIMAQWSSFYAEKGLGVTKALGDLLGPFIFALMMALGRTWYGFRGGKINLEKTLLLCSVLCTGCYLVAVFSQSPLASLAAIGVSGLGVSLMWPGMLSLSAERFTGAGASMFALMAVGGDIGCSIGPFITGTVSEIIEMLPAAHNVANIESLALKGGILAGVGFPLVMVAGMIAFAKKKKDN